jgi:Ca-activated chloride channel homolog
MLRSATSLLTLLLLQQTVLRVDVRLQEVVVSVRDDQNHLVQNLRAEDFIAEEDGVPQTIVHLTPDAEAPVSLGILIDTSASMAALPWHSLGALRASVGSTRVLMRLMKPGDEFQLMSFATAFSVRQTFTEDRRKIDEELRSLVPQGGTNLFPAVQRGLQEMKKARYRKRALIVITDAEASGNFNELRRDIRNSEVLIYTFAIRGANLEQISSSPLAPQADNTSRRLLDALAEESGGQWAAFTLDSNELVDRMITFVQEIAAELRGQYTMGYYPTPGNSSGNQIIRVRSASGKYRVRVHRELK